MNMVLYYIVKVYSTCSNISTQTRVYPKTKKYNMVIKLPHNVFKHMNFNAVIYLKKRYHDFKDIFLVLQYQI